MAQSFLRGGPGGGGEGDGGGGGPGGGGEGDGGGGNRCMEIGMPTRGGEGDGGGGGLGDGGGGGLGGTGQAVWQTYLERVLHLASFHQPPRTIKACTQSSLPALLGSPPPQLVYDSGVLDGLHTHAPSDAASVPPIHTEDVPAAAVTSSAFCAADCTLANWRPAAWQAASASPHERVSSLISV